MSTKSERQAAREVVAANHEARLAELLRRVGEAADRFRAGELDAHDADQLIFQYSRAAKELWKFCNLTVEPIARGDFAHASLRMASAAHLARFKGQSRVHTESDLRAFLAW